MNWRPVRSTGVSEAVAERMPVVTETQTETFAALRAHVPARLRLRHRAPPRPGGGRGRDRAGLRAGVSQALQVPAPARHDGGLSVRHRPQRRPRRAAPPASQRGPRGRTPTMPSPRPTSTSSWRSGESCCGRRWRPLTAASATCWRSSSRAISRTPRSGASSASRRRTRAAACTGPSPSSERPGATGGAGGSLDDALGDAGTLLVGTAGVLIRVLAVAIPLGAIGLAGWAAARAIRRRRRESVLV